MDTTFLETLPIIKDAVSLNPLLPTTIRLNFSFLAFSTNAKEGFEPRIAKKLQLIFSLSISCLALR